MNPHKLFLAILLSLSPLVVIGEERTHPLLNDFFISLKEKRHADFQKYLNTPLQKQAMEYVINPSKMYVGKAPEGADPHTKSGVALKEIKIPYWTEAVKGLHQSATKERNPISANAGVIIIKSYLGKNNKEFLPLYKDMVEILATTKTCNGLLEYADVLEQGIGTPVNTKKAYSTLLEAQKECEGIASKWQSTALQVKLSRLEAHAKK